MVFGASSFQLGWKGKEIKTSIFSFYYHYYRQTGITMTVALLNALLILQTIISKDSVLVFRKIHLEKLLLNASLPLPAPHELLNNQKID